LGTFLIFFDTSVIVAGLIEAHPHYEKSNPWLGKIVSMMESDKFYPTGGTCLSRFYYHHRYSDDLDFFFLGNMFLKQDFEAEFGQILNTIQKKFYPI
jgi:hypothetical protein